MQWLIVTDLFPGSNPHDGGCYSTFNIQLDKPLLPLALPSLVMRKTFEWSSMKSLSYKTV